MSKPKRIQRKRSNGWKMPEGAIYVGRPTRWGNPFDWFADRHGPSRAEVVEKYRGMFDGTTPWPYPNMHQPTTAEVREQLAGRNLACWCPLDQPCHADVLLELANVETAATMCPAPESGCCDLCAGGYLYGGEMCWDCLGTGHPHPLELANREHA